MENDNGLELSLGLSCGGSSTKPEGKGGSSSEVRTEDGERTKKVVADFKNFLNGVDQRHESGVGSQISTSEKPQENFFKDLSKAGSDVDASRHSNGKGLWVSESHRSAESEEERRQESSSKRSVPFDINHQKQLDRESSHSDLPEKSRTSHISLTTDGSTAENEDVAESEVEASTSKVVMRHDDSSRFVKVGSSPEASKDVNGTDPKVADLPAQKRFKSSSESEFKMGNYSASFSVQPANIVKDFNSLGAVSTSSHPQPTMMQTMHASSSEQLGMQPIVPGKMPLLFGYPPVQLPVLEKNNSFGQISHVQQLHPSYVGRGPSQSASTHVVAQNPPEATQYDGRTLDRAKGDGKQQVAEEGSSSQNGDDIKGSSANFRPKDTSERSTAECISFDFPAIKPGIAAELKFGGSGSYPNLPWVSTTGSGPNGRTISGVTYRYSPNQIKIVCACHGSHMYPEDFIRHASEEQVNQDGGAGYPSSNPATSS